MMPVFLGPYVRLCAAARIPTAEAPGTRACAMKFTSESRLGICNSASCSEACVGHVNQTFWMGATCTPGRDGCPLFSDFFS